MAVVYKEPYYILGSKLSVGAFAHGYLSVEEPDVNLDVWGTTRFRGPIVLTDAHYNFGGTNCTTGGNGSVVFGDNNMSLGYGTLVQGRDSSATGNGCVVVGRGLSAVNPHQAAFGQYNVGGEKGINLVVGDGSGPSNCADALRVYQSGNVFANALTTNNAINMLDPLYTGPLIQSRRMDTIPRGVGVDRDTTIVYGPAVQLALAGPSGTPLQAQLTLDSTGARLNSDCIFYGNVIFAGQTISTETTTVQCSDPVLTVAHGYAPLAGGRPYDLGLMGERPSGNTGVVWLESANTWAFILTGEGQGNLQYSNVTYANLVAGGTRVGDLTVTGAFTTTGDLNLRGDTVMNNALISNTFEVAGPGTFGTSLTVEGPSVLNTAFVANQLVVNNGVFPSRPDSWPLGQVDNRFGRAYVDTVDVYDSLQLANGVQDTYPARLGGFGEANIYLYTTSPFYQDTVGIYFDKGRNLYPAGKSAIVQRYDQWALRTAGQDRLVANTVTGNLTVANDMTLLSNLTVYGPQSTFTSNVVVLGGLQVNSLYSKGTLLVSGNLLPSVPDLLSIGASGNRFADAWLDSLDLYQAAGGGALRVGSGSATNVYVYGVGSCGVTLDSGAGVSGIVQVGPSLQLTGSGGNPIITANTVTSNVTFAGDELVQGNCAVLGQLSIVQNRLVVAGAFAGNTAFFSNVVTLGSDARPASNNLLSLGNTSFRFATAFLNSANLYAPSGQLLQAGSPVAANVYMYTDSADPRANVTLTLSKTGGASSYWTQCAGNAAWGTGGRMLPGIVQDDTSVTLQKDSLLTGNVVCSASATLTGQLNANSAVWANQSTFNGPLLPGANNTVVIGNTSWRFAQASLQRLDLYDAVSPLTVGSQSYTNVFVYANAGPTVISMGNNVSLMQNATAFTLSTWGQPRMVTNAVTGNVTFSGDLLAGGNLTLLGQTSVVNQDLRVLGHLAANSVFVSNTVVVDGSILTQTPNTWTLGSQNNRFAHGYFVKANLYNQDGSAQRIGSTQSANVGIFTDSAVVGQTASIFLDKAGLARTSLVQDATQFTLQQGGNVLLAVPNATGNVSLPRDVGVGGNLAVFGQSLVVLSDVMAGGRLSCNTVAVSNMLSLSGNVLVFGNVCLGNAGARVAAISARTVDVYSPLPQVTVGGPATVSLTLTSNNATADPAQVVIISMSQSATSNATLTQQAQAFVLSTSGQPRLTVAGASGNVFLSNALTVVAGVTTMGNIGVQGSQARSPLDFNQFVGEHTIAFAGQGWLGSNNQQLTYQSNGGHVFATNGTSPTVQMAANGVTAVFGTMQPNSDMVTDLGTGTARWRQVVAGNLYASADSTFNGAVVGSLGGASGAVGLTSNSRPSNAYVIVQHPSGNTWVNSASNGSVKVATGNVVGATFTAGQLRVGDALPPTRNLDVVQDAGVGGILFAAQVSGYASSAQVLLSNSAGWLQLGNVTVGNACQVKLSLLGQSTVGNASGQGGETDIYIASTANGQSVSGSWYTTGLNSLVANVRLVQTTPNTYGVFALLAGNTVSYSASASLTNAAFAHACAPSGDPGPGIVLPQQYILSGFSILGNSTGVLSNAIGGQPWLFNGNSIIYANYPNVGIGTNYPVANLDVRGSLNFTGQLLNNGFPLAVAQVVTVSNAFVDGIADRNLLQGNLGLAYPSSFRVGDYNPPSGVLEVAQGNTVTKLGGRSGRSADMSTTSNVISFNVANASPAWTFARLADYNNLATKTTVATIDGSGSYIQSSDRRLKTDIRDLSSEDVARLQQLRSRKFRVKGQDRMKYGLVAQEVMEVFPELVHCTEADMMAVDYVALVPLLLQVVQRLVTSTAAGGD